MTDSLDLINECLDGTESRGHRMGSWRRGSEFDSPDTWWAECEVCHLSAMVHPEPRPNQYDISGEAVALDCTPVKATPKQRASGGGLTVWNELVKDFFG